MALGVDMLPAQATAPVPIESRTYEHVDALIAEGLVRTAIVGQRPYSRLEVARLVAEARARVDDSTVVSRRDRPRIVRLIDAIAEATGVAPAAPGAYATTRERLRLDGASLGVTRLASPSRPVGSAGVSLGEIDAMVNPLAQLRGGRRFSAETTVWAETAASAEPLEHVALAAHVVSGPSTGTSSRSFLGAPRIQVLNVTAGFRNVVVQVGRQPILYGQGITGGPLSTLNAQPLDMVRIGNDVPATLPWVLRLLGPAKGSIFVADLGPGQNFPHARLAGWKMSFRPRPWLEVGASLLTQQGGQGAPAAPFHERVIDALTIIDVLVLQDRDLMFSNKLAGVDARLTLPWMELYYDGMVDDFDARRIRSSLWEENGFVTGVTVPALGPGGALRLDSEYQHTGLRYYQHGQFKSGLTFNGNIIGLPLGPRGNAVVARVRWDPVGRIAATMTAAHEIRSGDQYVVTTTGADDDGWQFAKTEDNPEEARTRVVGGLVVGRVLGRARLQAEAGVEQVKNAGFQPGLGRTNKLAQLSIVLGF